MTDKIVYSLISNAGGSDGRDHLDKGGRTLAVSFDKAELERNKNLPWCTIVPQVVDMEAAYRQAMAKLSPLDKLVLGIQDLTFNQKVLQRMHEQSGRPSVSINKF